jgi:hypothetical protein
MPSGSGPQVVKATGTSVAAAEVAVATITGSWQQPGGTAAGGNTGNYFQAQVNFTPGAAQTLLTLRIRQGAGVGGTLVGIAHPMVTVAAQQADWSFNELDNTAFALAGVNQSYTLTAQENAAGPGTVNEAFLTLETSSPVI